MKKYKYNEMSKEEQIEMVRENGLLIFNIDNPSIELQLEAVKQNGYAIQFIDNPSLEAQIAAIKKFPYSIEYINNPSEEVQLTAVKDDGYAIKYIDNPSLEVQLEAVRRRGFSIKYINNPSIEVQLVAIKQNIESFYLIKDLESSIDNNHKYLHIKDNKEYRMYICKYRRLYVDLSNKDDIRYTIGCQYRINKDTFIDRIYNDCIEIGKGLEENPYRQEYLDIIESIEG